MSKPRNEFEKHPSILTLSRISFHHFSASLSNLRRSRRGKLELAESGRSRNQRNRLARFFGNVHPTSESRKRDRSSASLEFEPRFDRALRRFHHGISRSSSSL